MATETKTVNTAVRGTQPPVTVVSSANADAKKVHANEIAELEKHQARMAAPNPKHSFIPPTVSKKTEEKK